MKMRNIGTLCVCVFTSTSLCLYLWQQCGDKVFVFFTEPFNDVAQALQSRLRKINTNRKIQSDSAVNRDIQSHLMSG